MWLKWFWPGASRAWHVLEMFELNRDLNEISMSHMLSVIRKTAAAEVIIQVCLKCTTLYSCKTCYKRSLITLHKDKDSQHAQGPSLWVCYLF